MLLVTRYFPRLAFGRGINLPAASCLTLLLALNNTVGINTSIAQSADEPPVCTSLADDPDGDGFGQVPLTGDICIVTEETPRPPMYINSRTGEPAQLIRAFWDGNADLIDRDIVCQQFSASGETGFLFEFRWFRFLAIPTGSTAGFYYAADTQAELTPDSSKVPFLWDWSVDYGRLKSESNASFTSLGHFPGAKPRFASTDDFNTFGTPGLAGDTNHSYAELFINEEGAQAVRFYETEGILQSVAIDYTECSDASGQSFGPSGSPENPATTAPSPYVETALPFTGTQENKPVVVNRETGVEVNFETGIWDAQAHFVDRTVTCTSYVYLDTSSRYVTGFNGGFTSDDHYEPRIAGFAANGGAVISLFEGNHSYGEWSVNGNEASFVGSQWYEPISATGFSFDTGPGGVREGVRYWGRPGLTETERSGSYTDCYARDGAGSVMLRPNPVNNTTEENEIDAEEEADTTENGDADNTDNEIDATPVSDSDSENSDNEIDTDEVVDASENADVESANVVDTIPVVDSDNDSTEDVNNEADSDSDASVSSSNDLPGSDDDSSLETQSSTGGGPLDIFVLLAGMVLLLLSHRRQILSRIK